MKFFLFILILFIAFGCTNKEKVYWCGDHPCINKKEREAYFKKTMIVEIKDLSKNKKKYSNIEKIMQQTQLNEKQRIKNEKKFAKQSRKEKKRKIKEQKRLAKQARLDERRKNKTEKILVKKETKKISKKKILNEKSNDAPLNDFTQLIKKINKKNSSRPYPDINNIPN